VQLQFVAGRRRRRWPPLTVTAAVAAVLGLVALAAPGLVAPAHESAAAGTTVTVPHHTVTPIPSPPPPAPPPPPPVAAVHEAPVPAGRAALVATLDGLLAAPGVQGTLTVAVVDEHGRALVERGPDVAVLPASTQKLVTAAAALETLGPDHRFRTALHATAVPVQGVLTGDLVLVGSGDPALASPLYGQMIYPARPRTPLERLADAVVALGITHVEGAVVGDPRAYATSPAAEGWFPRYFHDLDARYVSSLTAEAGLTISYDEPTDDLEVELSHDPVLTAASVLRDLLDERGVTVAAEPRVVGPIAPSTIVLAEVDSPPLAELLRHTVRRSDNHMADTLLHAVALHTVGEAGWAAGDRAVREALSHLDLDWTGVVLADGSGLSRSNRSTAGFLTQLEAAMYTSSNAATWGTLMAVAGHEGTLRNRLVGTPADGRFTGKTGTLDDVRSIAGTVHGPEGAAYHLTVVGNDLIDPASRTNIRALMDNLALALATDLYRVS